MRSNEQWMPVKGYEGKYLVSSYGNIKSLRRGQLLRPYKTNKGYLVVMLSYKKDSSTGKRKGDRRTVHRLVLTHFIENKNNKPQVNHIDGDKANNNLSNLEWVNNSENHLHRFSILNHTPSALGKFGKDNPLSKKVRQLSINGELIKVWDSLSDIERQMKIFGTNVSKVCLNKQKTAYGYKWEYVSKAKSEMTYQHFQK